MVTKSIFIGTALFSLLLISASSVPSPEPESDPFALEVPPPAIGGLMWDSDIREVLEGGWRLAIKTLNKGTCKSSFFLAFPWLGLQTPLGDVFRDFVSIIPKESLPYIDLNGIEISLVPSEVAGPSEGAASASSLVWFGSALGLTYCDGSNSVLVDKYELARGGPELAALVYIHEFSHVMECADTISTYGYHPLQSEEDRIASELRAEALSMNCMGLETNE